MGELQTLKIVFAGDGAVGKSTMIASLLGKTKEITMTKGISIETLKIDQIGSKEIEAAFWDLAGQKQFRFLIDSLIRGTNICIFVYDLTRFTSLANLEEDWLPRFKGNQPEAHSNILVGNKKDLGQTISDDEIIRVATEYNLTSIKVSSMDGENMNSLMNLIVEKSDYIKEIFAKSTQNN